MSNYAAAGKNPRVTIRDVAAKAEVALSSVSRVLSGHPDVSDRMRQRVEAAAAELGYEPDFLGQSLRSGQTLTIGFLLRDISNPLFGQVARRCEHDLRAGGYSMIITSSDGERSVEAANLDLLRRRRVDGLIASLVSETAESTINELKQYKVPIVLLDREVDGLVASAVLNDHYTGVRQATEALLAAGHTRVALITGGLDVRSSRERKRALEDAFAAAGKVAPEELQFYARFDQEHGEETVRALMRLPQRPTAILTGGIGPTMGAILAVRELGLELGTDITVVALDEWPYFDALAPSIPSVTRESDELGAAAAALMLEALSGAAPRVVHLETSYRDRSPGAVFAPPLQSVQRD